jgi:hypothetical protein
MNAERQKRLIEAYGADPRRWPAADRGVAIDGALDDDLTEARALDAWLQASPSPQPSPGLRDRVMASALEAGLGRVRRAWRPDRLAWFSGAGWAAAACAGVVAGIGLTSQLTADVQADAVLYQAAFAAVDDTEVLG